MSTAGNGQRPANVRTLREVLGQAQRDGYALGAFAARYTPMIRPILRGMQRMQSPAIVQISEKELERYGIAPREVAAEFYAALPDEAITVPVVLHLDHTRDVAVIEEAIAAGFTSVMIDASEKSLDENIEVSRQVAEYAHQHGVSVEAELGRIGTTDFVETESDEEMYTDPVEAERFVRETGVDALAVSVGTAHGVYKVRQPRIDYARLRSIRERTAVALVLHGGSGVPAPMMAEAIRLPEGGVSKVNIATDLELALLGSLGREERLTNTQCKALPAADLVRAQSAVEETVCEKIRDFVISAGRALDVPS
jgi:ketose-bisphosphate aldolase